MDNYRAYFKMTGDDISFKIGSTERKFSRDTSDYDINDDVEFVFYLEDKLTEIATYGINVFSEMCCYNLENVSITAGTDSNGVDFILYVEDTDELIVACLVSMQNASYKIASFDKRSGKGMFYGNVMLVSGYDIVNEYLDYIDTSTQDGLVEVDLSDINVSIDLNRDDMDVNDTYSSEHTKDYAIEIAGDFVTGDERYRCERSHTVKYLFRDGDCIISFFNDSRFKSAVMISGDDISVVSYDGLNRKYVSYIETEVQ